MGPVAQYYLSTTISMQNLVVFCFIAALATVNCMPVCENGKVVQSDDGTYDCKCNDNFKLNEDGNCIEGADRKRRSNDDDDDDCEDANMKKEGDECVCIEEDLNGDCVEQTANRKRRSNDDNCEDANMKKEGDECVCIEEDLNGDCVEQTANRKRRSNDDNCEDANMK